MAGSSLVPSPTYSWERVRVRVIQDSEGHWIPSKADNSSSAS
jgi:hypothetical protein